jgi:hypothetical protein
MENQRDLGTRSSRITPLRALVLLAVLLATALPGGEPPARASDGMTGVAPPEPADHDDDGHLDLGDDIILERGTHLPGAALAPLAADPLGLLIGLDTIREHSIGGDQLGVWVCDDLGRTVSQVVADFTATTAPYLEWLSQGRYRPNFLTGGTIDCDTQSPSGGPSGLDGALVVGPWSGGFASPGFVCGESPCGYPGWPSNGRRAVIGYANWRRTLAHEMGHMIHWPHSYTGTSSFEYDDATEVMSGNFGVLGGGSYGAFTDPYASMSINRYAAGWIHPSAVRVHDGSSVTFDLAAVGGTGIQMAVIKADTAYYVFTARVRSAFDPIPSHWQGVTVHRVVPCSSALSCPELGFRRVSPEPAIPFDYRNRDAYDRPLPHTIGVGGDRTIAGTRVTVVRSTTNGYAVTMTGGSGTPSTWNGTFYDDDGNIHEPNIEIIAAAGVTNGCNQAGTRYCPADLVTRAQMASFLARAFQYPPSTRDWFPDDDGSVHEPNINRVADAGVTTGYGDGTYRPSGLVTRAQMGSFLARALGLAPVATNRFEDVRGVHAGNINAIAEVGITLGCNPEGTLYCPDDLVRRDQMASFIARALGVAG